MLSDHLRRSVPGRAAKASGRIRGAAQTTAPTAGAGKDRPSRQLEQKGRTDSVPYRTHQLAVSQVQADIGRIMGTETEASLDSELSLVLCSGYDLYRWQPNALRNPQVVQPFRTLMVSRLDGPSYGIAQGLVDKALAAEEKGLAGVAYVDSRGLYGKDLYSYYDQSFRDLALLIRLRTSLPAKEEQTAALFPPGSCPQTALYGGWYSLAKYVDAFEFVDGAVGFHLASSEAVNLRDPNSTQWCPALLRHGITATIGPVGEPYLHAFPEPKVFFRGAVRRPLSRRGVLSDPAVQLLATAPDRRPALPAVQDEPVALDRQVNTRIAERNSSLLGFL